jgi:ribosomal protein S18 acetylase RimI-like enzyme
VTLPDPYTVRPASADDLDAMVAVANAYDLADFGRPDTAPEYLAEDLGRPAASAWLVLDAKGHAAAFAIAGLEGRALEAFGRVHPDHTGRGIGGALTEATEARAAERAVERGGDLVLHNSITSTDAAARRLLDERGYTLVRFFWHMERGLRRADLKVPADPDGVIVRPARNEDDLRAARAVLDESFAGHWMFEPEPFDEWRAHLDGMAGATLLAMDADGVVGAVTSMPTSHAGWIEELGVREASRGRGVGALLLRHAFARLAEAGAREVRLNMDADNGTGATRLYERVGMRVRREWVVYEKRVTAVT